MVKSTNIKSALYLKYHYGQDEKGKEVYKNQTFSNVSTNAKDEDIYEVGVALGTLLEDPNVQVFTKDTNALGQE